VIHRDVKPSNLLLMADGTIRLSDLGVAAVGRPPRGLPSEWIEEDIGTLGYTAPELLRDPSTATPAVDVYGLGVTLYEMLSGELPYRMGVSETELELRERIVAGERPVPLIGRTEIPGKLAEIVMRAIDPDLSVRFAELDQLARALGQVIS
jgi:serine/threonine-protein kinase